jgi:hypothetical protein
MRRYIPVIVLFVLSPFIAEVLFGASPISNLGALLPVLLLYGGGAVLLRELARRRDALWGRVALLGAAYAMIEEGLALQSMFNPNLFSAASYGGRALGVNWVWSEWTIGYHIAWSITIPILLAELLFPARRAVPWLGRIGVTLFGVLYVLGALALAAIFRLFVAPGFQAPIVLLAAAALVIVALVALALGWPTNPLSARMAAAPYRAPSPWLVGLVTLLAAAAWFALIGLPQAWREGALVLAPMLGVLLLVAIVVVLIRKWSASAAWNDLHRLALVWGTLLVVMGIGFFRITAGNLVDQLGQGIASVVALVLLALFTARVQRREATAETRSAPPNSAQVARQHTLPNSHDAEQRERFSGAKR